MFEHTYTKETVDINDDIYRTGKFFTAYFYRKVKKHFKCQKTCME